MLNLVVQFTQLKIISFAYTSLILHRAYDILGASYIFPEGIAVDATGSCVDKNARDVNLSKHNSPKRR